MSTTSNDAKTEQAELEAALSGNEGRGGPYPSLSTAELERVHAALVILYPPATIDGPERVGSEREIRRMCFNAGLHAVGRTMGYELDARKRNGVP